MTPSAGALRAARAMSGLEIAPGMSKERREFVERNVANMANVIDRESGLSECIEALEKLSKGNRSPNVLGIAREALRKVRKP